VDEGESILAFKSGGDVVHVEHHPHVNGDFLAGGLHPQPLQRSSARFYVHPSGTRFRLEYKN
jgi:hypothetical protein